MGAAGYIRGERVSMEQDDSSTWRDRCMTEPCSADLARKRQFQLPALGSAVTFEGHNFTFWKKMVVGDRVIHPLLVAELPVLAVEGLYIALCITHEIRPDLRQLADANTIDGGIATHAFCPIAGDHEVVLRIITQKINGVSDDDIHIQANHQLAMKTQKIGLKCHEFIPVSLEVIIRQRVGYDRRIEPKRVVRQAVERMWTPEITTDHGLEPVYVIDSIACAPAVA